MFKSSVKNGAIIGLKTTWTLGKIIFPVTLIVGLLQHTPVLPWVIRLIEPFMGILACQVMQRSHLSSEIF